QRRGAGGRADVDRAGIEEFERLVGAERLHPAHADAVLGERLLDQPLLLEDERERIVGREVEADLAWRGFGTERGEGGGCSARLQKRTAAEMHGGGLQKTASVL